MAMETGYQQNIKVGRIIVIAMMGGLIAFGVVVAVLTRMNVIASGDIDANLMLGVLGVLALSEIVAYTILRKTMLTQAKSKLQGRSAADPPLDETAQILNVLTIIGAAMCEGIGLFGLVIVLITGNYAAAAFPLVALVLLALQIPSEHRLRSLANHLVEPDFR